MDTIDVKPFFIVDTEEAIPETFLDLNLADIFFKAGPTLVILGSYMTRAQECVWTARQLNLCLIRLNTGINDIHYLSIDLKYEDIERIDYYFGADCLKIFVKIQKPTMDAMRTTLNTIDKNYELRFHYESEELIERYLTLFFNLSDKSKTFIQWLTKVSYKIGNGFILNQFNFDLSVKVVLEEEIKRLNRELSQSKKANEELLAQFNNNYYLEIGAQLDYEIEERPPEPRG